MLKRVNKTRLGISVVVTAVLVLALATAYPVHARQEISDGQSGDPGDGEEVFSGGSAGDSQTLESGALAGNGREGGLVVLIPVLIPGLYAVQLVFIAIKLGAKS